MPDRQLWRECKSSLIQETTEKYQKKLENSKNLKKKPSKATLKRCKLFISILKSQSPSKAHTYESQLAALLSPPSSPGSSDDSIRYLSEFHIKDYQSLLTSASFLESRESEWESFEV